VTAPKRLGLSPYAYCLPLRRKLEEEKRFVVHVDATTRNAIKLREHHLDAAFLSPIDYARESSLYNIVPGIAVSSRGGNDAVVMHFREHLHTIKTLVVDPSSTSEIILARILLAERFDVEPSLVPATGPLEHMLAKGDAALLVGDTALGASFSHPNKLDLIEEWTDMADLPYVHGFWCGREHDLATKDIHALQRSRDRGVEELADISLEAPVQPLSLFPSETLHSHLQTFGYEFTDEVRDALQEFFRYAYYYGVLPDVADLHYYPAESATPSGADDFSSN
jgi:chorismate dehydratase